MAVCLIFNQNCTRRLFTFDINKPAQKSQKAGMTQAEAATLNEVWFTCSSKAYDFDTNEEFIAVATNEGRIFKVKESVPG